jgi:two-component system chemotaxis response regulator CheB
MPADAAPALARPDAIRVMVVDDSVVVRGLVARWLEEDKDIVVVGTPRNGKLAVESVARLDPDVIILDVEMPEMDGLEALPLLLRAKPGVAVIMASTHRLAIVFSED